MLKCPFCGFDNEDGALFCEQCKSDLSGVEPTPAAGAPPAAEFIDETVPMAAPDPFAEADVMDAEAVPMAEPMADDDDVPMADAMPVDDDVPMADAMPVDDDDEVPMAAEAIPSADPAPIAEEVPFAPEAETTPMAEEPAAPAMPETVAEPAPIPAVDSEPAPAPVAEVPPEPAPPPPEPAPPAAEAPPAPAAPAPAAPAPAAAPAATADEATFAPDAQPKFVVVRGQKINMEFPIYPDLNFIGRADDKPVDIDLEDQEPPDRIFCSRQHAVINFENGTISVEDLNSANGTYVNREKIYPGQKRMLKLNDIVQIGNVQLKLKV